MVQLEEEVERNTGPQGVDQRIILRPGELDQTQSRPVGLLAYEFRIYRNKVVLAQSVADPGELFCGFDQAHGRALIA